jgi:hypothetical protein
MFFRVRDQLQRKRFNFLCRDIFRTPPLRMHDGKVTLVTQVSHRDLVMYLIAIKSIYRFLATGEVVVLDDGSLISDDHMTINEHLPSARIVGFKDIGTASTPKGGCWERLLLIANLVRDTYVMQVDSDSLTLNDIPEVLDYIAQNRSFTLLGAGSFPAVEPMLDACNRAKCKDQRNMEPQGVSERSLDQFPGGGELKYVRGNAAFAGFARSSFTSSDVEYFSRNMERICGTDKWHEWGSEQVTSNLIIANSAKTGILEHPKYTSYYALPDVDYDQSSFVHFMGTHRFENGCYSTLARRVIRHQMSGNGNRTAFEEQLRDVTEANNLSNHQRQRAGSPHETKQE